MKAVVRAVVASRAAVRVAAATSAVPPGARNLDSGHQQIQAQIPMETEEAPEHDVVWVINSDDDFDKANEPSGDPAKNVPSA